MGVVIITWQVPALQPANLLRQGQLLHTLRELMSEEAISCQLDGLLRGEQGQVCCCSSGPAEVAQSDTLAYTCWPFCWFCSPV